MKSLVLQINENNSEINLKIRKIGTYYINQIFKLKCFVDLLKLDVFPNAKEFTESFGVFKAVQKHFSKRYDFSKNYRVIVVGDGHTPRTACLFAFMTNYIVYSVDPLLREKSVYKSVKRLNLIKDRIENVKNLNADIVVLPHAHVELNQIEHLNCDNIVALPCCVKQDLYKNKPPDIEYEDFNILSPHRTIKIWKQK